MKLIRECAVYDIAEENSIMEQLLVDADLPIEDSCIIVLLYKYHAAMMERTKIGVDHLFHIELHALMSDRMVTVFY